MRSWEKDLPFFSVQEMACKCCGQMKLDINFAVALPYLRDQWGVPMHLNSVCRCTKHNKALNNGTGGHPTSLHLIENPKHPSAGAMAADVAWRRWDTDIKLDFAQLAYGLGWSVGLHNGFCHIDRRKDIRLAQSVFLYGEWDDHFQLSEVTQ